ncbi:MAG TPA: hypothetical protein DCP92_14595, partial [Nitrospiraceae bacterium]|nr:hypothetical protein [Nitrospiraceae bacterium]
MLNELNDLARSLKRANIVNEDWHSKFKPCPKYKAFWMYPSEKGEIEAIEPVAGGIQLNGIRKWEANNGESFPVFNIPPLYDAVEVTAKQKLTGIKKRLQGNEGISIDEINEAIAICKPWDEETRNNTGIKVKNSLNRTAEAVKHMLGRVPQSFMAISDLIDRAKKVEFTAFYDSVSKLAIEGLSEGKAEFIDILFKGQNSIQLIFELRDWARKYDYPAIHREVQKWMNSMFLEQIRKKQGNAQLSADGFGEDAAGKDEQKYPEVKLPVLGQVKLRSMFKDIPAQTRYGMIEADSFPAGNKVRMEMKSALEWLVAEERKG